MHVKLVTAAALIAWMTLPTAAEATTITPTFGAAKSVTVDQAALCAGTTTCVVGIETYNTRTTTDFTNGFSTDFGTGGTITGTYQSAVGANLQVLGNDQYGGAYSPQPTSGACTSTTCRYPELFSGSYTLSLATQGVPGVNYFGVWISALDNNNDLKFYNGSTLVLDFTPALMTKYINLQADAASYKGNPQTGQNTGEYYAFVNFIATDGTFDKVVFSNAPGTGFESDNATVAYRTPSSSVFGNAIPEPASMLLAAAGMAGLAVVRRRRPSHIA